MPALAGDGVVISTPVGSSGYAISAGGPLLAHGLEGFVFTPLAKHGGFCPPLVMAPRSELQLEIGGGFSGTRIEIDGQAVDESALSLTISLRAGVATMVAFEDQETFVGGLRRRRIIIDSPRASADADEGSDACPV